MLATLLASTPLLEESWKLCGQANSAAPQGYLIKQIGDVCYVAFSGVQILAGLDPDCRYLVPIERFGNGLFSALRREGEEEGETVMVHAGLLQLFLSFYANPIFQNQVCLSLYIFPNLHIISPSVHDSFGSKINNPGKLVICLYMV